ncbi:MAG: hypothetical protein RR840_10060 [Clostridium sp.]
MILDGGWIVHSPVSDEYCSILNKALEGVIGSTFEPISVAIQVVNGINYLFIAKAIPTTDIPTIKLVKIFVSAVPAGSEPKLDKIEDIV